MILGGYNLGLEHVIRTIRIFIVHMLLRSSIVDECRIEGHIIVNGSASGRIYCRKEDITFAIGFVVHIILSKILANKFRVIWCRFWVAEMRNTSSAAQEPIYCFFAIVASGWGTHVKLIGTSVHIAFYFDNCFLRRGCSSYWNPPHKMVQMCSLARRFAPTTVHAPKI